MQRKRLSEVARKDVSRETFARIETYISLLLDENRHQNLISKRTEQDVFERHIIDSAQLLAVEPGPHSSWIDIGTGPGLPGVILAILSDCTFTLVEPRPLRVNFLEKAIAELQLGPRVATVLGKASAVEARFDVITGRAVAPVARFLSLSYHLSTEKTVWVLPKGRKAHDELEEARHLWHFDATIVPSETDADASIIRIENVTPRKRGGKR